jgi:serine/threonine protein kinase
MVQCPKCSAENLPESRFCSSCGQELSSLSQMPTVAVPEGEAAPSPVQSPHVGRIVSSDSVPAGGFTPGTILADRYRIIGLLGRGGMGEVYRADDLKLGQPVALKFLPPKLSDDPVRRERFFAEVRITRQLSHPNICRVYDIGEVDGRHFLSMEYIDGEDLASLMKRIGSLTNEKALDIARQLVAGLSVAHERGVLHRDLKPANIMLDGHGRVRITDFGLAIAVGDESQAEEIAGTPAYMAPEQLAGKGATVRSDIYSLGLILYEIYTGKKAFKAKTLAELREQKETQTPRAPSELRDGIDPVVERVIQRCMEKDPSARPASVAQIAQALPGGDPLAAAIAAGETPSPEMVAASGRTEGLRPWIAWTCLIFTILSLGVMAVLAPQYSILDKVPIEKSPEVMVQTARDFLEDLGYTDTPGDSAILFETDENYLNYVFENNRSPNRFEKIPALTIQFAYRQSPKLLGVTDPFTDILNDPPFRNPGESIVWLDSQERLIGLRIIPPVEHVQADSIQPPNWSLLFEAAGLNEDNFDSAETESIPPVYDDIRAAWTGTLPDFPETVVRIEAAAWQGRPVFWRMIVPSWDNLSTAALDSGLAPGVGNDAIIIILIFILILVFIACPAFFARRNLRMGRGDRRGAARLAGFILGLMAVAWLFGTHHVASVFGEVVLFISNAAYWLLFAVWLWLMYLALEPYARRRWPGMLISWSRLLAGKYRDPLVGRDLLIGIVTAAALVIPSGIVVFCHKFFGTLQGKPGIPGLPLFSGSNAIVTGIMYFIAISILLGLVSVFIVFILRMALRKTWAVAVVLVLLASVVIYPTAPSIVGFTLTLIFFGLALFVCFRFGLVSIIAFFIYILIFSNFPILPPVSDWYFKIGLTGLVLLLAFASYAFRTSLGGRPIFGTPRLDE